MTAVSNADIHNISQLDLFKGLHSSVINSALEGATIKCLKHREFLYLAGSPADSFSIVLNGALKLIRPNARGMDIIVHFAASGDLVGALVMNYGELASYPISAKSMGITRVACIPKSTFVRYWKGNTDLQTRIYSILYRRMFALQDDKSRFPSPLKSRIAGLLLRFLDQDKNINDQALSLNLTRQEIADSLGVAVESVIRIMSEWTDVGVLHRPDQKKPEIISIEKLLKFVE